MPSTLDKTRVLRAFSRNYATYEAEATVQHAMARRLVDALRPHVSHHLDRALEVGCGTGLVSRLLCDQCSVNEYFVNDLVPTHCTAVVEMLSAQGVPSAHALPGDIESLATLPTDCALVISGATLQWVQNPGAVVGRLLDALRPGGLLAFTSFGPENCREVRALSGIGLSYPPLDALRAMIALRATVLVAEEWEQALHFESARQVLRHLKQTGVNGIERHRWTPSALREFCRRYEAAYSAPQGIPLTYHPILMVARRP